MKEREIKRIGNDCVIHIKKILTKFNDTYIVIVLDYYNGWTNSDVNYEYYEFKTEEDATKFYNED